MILSKTKLLLLFTTIYCLGCKPNKQSSLTQKDNTMMTIKNVLNRSIGTKNSNHFSLELIKDSTNTDWFSLENRNDSILVQGNSPVALIRGVYDYLKNECNSIYSWSGKNIQIPSPLPPVNRKVQSPYQYRYYFNVVTHGYSTPYWDWERWEKEIDWMTLHGINMPLIGGAHEAILARVFKKIGLQEEEINQYFSGPAHFPWNRMGNLNGWDGTLPKSYFQKQIKLTHQMLERMRTLNITPIIHAFAGFVPKGIKRVFPDAEVRELGWGGGLPLENNGFILSPTSKLFLEIGSLYIKEWEKEFGEAEYYLADSFNEMDAPLSNEPEKALAELASYGKSVYQSIKNANPNATWVMQGWTFPYHKKNGKLFWTPERLKALVSEVPDDKLLILDLANEYNHDFWKIPPSWKMYDGFFNKKWIYSFIPNMGAKIPLNGKLNTYASIPFDALNYKNKKNLIGFGFAPEGIENNELIYELLSDVAWRTQPINLDNWLANYATQRYGSYPQNMKTAYDWLRKSAYGTFTDHPMHRYQFRPYHKPEGVEDHATVHHSLEFGKAVEAFLQCAPELKNSSLYTYDAIEMVTQYLGLVADQQLLRFLDNSQEQPLKEPLHILFNIDKLLASHPNRKLNDWIDFARKWGDTKEEKNYYESNAKRLITTWGGDPVNDYSGRVWNGLIKDYYIPRWENYHNDNSNERKQHMRKWEEKWIVTPYNTSIQPFSNPLGKSIELFNQYKNNLSSK
ncbi:Glycoside hydrolase, family GH89 lipoprotein precursor. Probable alpha-N-acetylglucosaminidase [Tenacibaculum sp. 190524A02b]|uniref:alpha-N-acetylglucosaminidase n=1 Tax=Tenacibaculum vairaonense TaxID=3137860 RepID=UPI0032B168DB